MSAYCTNRDRAVEDVIDADPVASALRTLMAKRTMWTGTATDLLGALAEAAGERVAKSKTWPNSPKALSGQLRRAATFLRKTGIDISFEREGGQSVSPRPKTERHNRPHCPRRPQIRRRSIPPTVPRLMRCGRSAILRTVGVTPRPHFPNDFEKNGDA
jgi:hypothetical protein